MPDSHIRAVGVEYDQLSGAWWAPDIAHRGQQSRYRDYEDGALTISDGKSRIIRELLGDQRGRSLLVGDGTSDLLAGEAVDLFVGFGGVSERPRVFKEARTFVHSPGLSPLLPLAAGPAAIDRCRDASHRHLFAKANKLVNSGAVTFHDDQLSTKFTEAYQAVYPRAD